MDSHKSPAAPGKAPVSVPRTPTRLSTQGILTLPRPVKHYLVSLPPEEERALCGDKRRRIATLETERDQVEAFRELWRDMGRGTCRKNTGAMLLMNLSP